MFAKVSPCFYHNIAWKFCIFLVISEIHVFLLLCAMVQCCMSVARLACVLIHLGHLPWPKKYSVFFVLFFSLCFPFVIKHGTTFEAGGMERDQ